MSQFNKLMEMHLLLSRELISSNRKNVKNYMGDKKPEANNVQRKNYLSSSKAK